MKFIVYFPSGIEKYLEKILDDSRFQFDILSINKGEALIESKQFEELISFPLFNNVLYIVEDIRRIDASILRYVDKSSIRAREYRNKQNVALDNKKVSILENDLLDLGLRIDRAKPDFEYWIIKNDLGFNGEAIRLTRHPDFHSLEKSAIRPEIAYFLNYLSEPNKQDIYLDPFCGSCSLGVSRAENWGYKKIICSDIDLSRIRIETEKISNFEILKLNYKDIDELNKDGINKIVTDPEWGIFNKEVNIEKMYELFFYKAKRLLPQDGLLVFLTHRNNRELINSIINKKKTLFHKVEEVELFIWNQKAVALKLRND